MERGPTNESSEDFDGLRNSFISDLRAAGVSEQLDHGLTLVDLADLFAGVVLSYAENHVT